MSDVISEDWVGFYCGYIYAGERFYCVLEFNGNRNYGTVSFNVLLRAESTYNQQIMSRAYYVCLSLRPRVV